ncbi:MAG: glycosyltransferase, partial [Candidatus Omnitrophica bacterium]|nr:glycosyltransferase [Candidatus Omnitrophota bacterium]
ELIYRAILKASLIFDGSEVTFIVRSHPNQNIRQFKGLRKRYRAFNVSIAGQDVPFTDLLSKADIMINRSSSTLLEACNAGIPVVIVNLSGRPDYFDACERGAALGVYREEDLPGAIRTILNDKVRRIDLIDKGHEYFKRYVDTEKDFFTESLALIRTAPTFL